MLPQHPPASPYLGSGEEDLVSDVSQPTGHHPKSDSREHVGVVALARKESPSLWKRDWIKRTATGEDGATLQHRRTHGPEDERAEHLRAAVP